MLLLNVDEVHQLSEAMAPLMQMDPVACETLLAVDIQLDEAMGNLDGVPSHHGGATIELDEEQWGLIVWFTDLNLTPPV